jgi:hypothetical protein
MSTYNPSHPSTSFIGNDDFKWWLGTVKNADDKDAKLGRVKVNILGYHRPDEKPSNLPWAIVSGPTTSPGVHGAGSAGAQLKAGSFVIGFFLDYPDCQQPIVLGTLLSKIKPVFDKNSQEAKDYIRGVDNVIKKQNTSESGVNEAATPPEDRSSTSDAAAVAEHSISNPSGKLTKVPLADGKNAGGKTLNTNLSYAVTAVATAIAQARKVDNAETEITVETDTEDQTLFVKDTQDFPWNGWLQIGSEKVTYTNKDEGKFVSVVRGGDGTKAVVHQPGTKVRLITKSEYLGVDEDEDGNKTEGDLLGTFTDTLVDIKSFVDDQLDMIKNSLYWLVNQVKSWLMGQATQIMNTLGYSIPSPGPGVTKTITEAIMFIIRQIACTFDATLIDSLFGIIENAINSLYNTAMDIIDSVECVFDAIFETIFNITDLVQQVIDTVNDIASGISGLDLENLSDLSQINVTSVLDFIFQLLKIGCYKDTEDPYAISFDSCAIGFALDCGIGSGKGVGASIAGIKGKLNPQYTRIIGQFSETGTMVLMDDTPYNTRLVIEHGPSKSGIHISDNGDVRITNAQRKTEVVIKDNDIVVHGNVNMMVDGNYHLKVGKDYHLEVLGHYNLSVNKESKLTYYGEHKSIYKNDSRIEATNGLALTASKLGLSASGQYELFSPVATNWVNEMNNICIGSFNVITTFYNKHVGLNNFTQVVGNNISNRIGTSFEIGIGTSNKTQLGSEQDWYGGTYSEIGTGIWSENKLSADQKNTLGVTSLQKSAASWEAITGAKFLQTTGLFSDTAQGIKFSNSAAICFNQAPLNVTS